MTSVPETRYARLGDAHLAYQVVGDGGPDLLFCPPRQFPIDLLWDEPTVAGHLRRLASFSRLILTDLSVRGSSDAVPIPTVNRRCRSWTDGLVAGARRRRERVRVDLRHGRGAWLPVLLLAASHPERVRSLVLWSPFARYLRAADHPFGIPRRPGDVRSNSFE